MEIYIAPSLSEFIKISRMMFLELIFNSAIESYFNRKSFCCRWSIRPAAGMDQFGTDGNWSWFRYIDTVS